MHRSLTGRRVRALAFVGFVTSVSACTGAADEPPSATIAPTPDSTAPITATSEGEPLATPPEFVSSDGVLSATLTLERTVVDARPPRVEYVLTEDGRRLTALIDALRAYASR